ncbi:MAG: hypothetical protein ACP5E5_15670, partial [Acidobacteriaceae bacterium]
MASGANTNWAVTVGVTDTAGYAPSFSAAPAGMSGGANAVYTSETAYSYSLQHDVAGDVTSADDS